jgi:hypothetical protein
VSVPLIVLSAKSQVLINVIVDENYINTHPILAYKTKRHWEQPKIAKKPKFAPPNSKHTNPHKAHNITNEQQKRP